MDLDIEEKIKRLRRVLNLFEGELVKAWTKHPGAFHNAHEGHSVIREEFEELWEHVRADTAYSNAGLKEAVQTGAMCARFLVELVDCPHSAKYPSPDDTYPGTIRDLILNGPK